MYQWLAAERKHIIIYHEISRDNYSAQQHSSNTIKTNNRKNLNRK
jgi:hypothetical protein